MRKVITMNFYIHFCKRGKVYSGELTKNINAISDLFCESSDINDIKYYDTKVEKYIKKLRDLTSMICKVDPTNDEASENYISHLTELEFKLFQFLN